MECGGAERQLAYIAEGLVQRNYDVHVALLRGGENLDRLQNSGAKIHKLSCNNNYDPMILVQLIKIIRRVQPHLIQTWLPQMDILGGFVAILIRKPFIVTERSCSLAYRNNWKNSLRILVARRAAAIVANSEGGRAHWDGNVKRAISIRVIRNGVPFDEIAKASITSGMSINIEPENEIILFAGRFSVEKNLANLVNAMRQVLARRTKTVAIFFGEGSILNDLTLIQKEHDLHNRIRIMGFTSQFWSWLKRANVFVSASLFEGHPNTVLEAVACKCPVVVSDIPAHREFLDENSAYFVTPSSPPAIAEGILKALSNPENAMFRAKSAYNKIRYWSVKSVVQKYIDVYEEILN